MDSFSRNSCKPHRAPGLAVAVSLLLGSAAHAADPTHSFVLTAYSNGTGGAELLSGDYPGAVEALKHRTTPASMDPSTTSNNRCVILAVTRQWDSAHKACDQAVRDAQQEKTLLPSYQHWARTLKSDYLAVALSNRAVVHWMAAEADAAASDLKRAEGLSPHADFVMHNRAAMESHAAVAQVAVAPPAR